MAARVPHELLTKADLDALEHRMTLRVIGFIAAFNTLLFALLRIIH